MSDQRLQGQVMMVTGASSGIGLACAERFVQEGAVVHGFDLAEKPEAWIYSPPSARQALAPSRGYDQLFPDEGGELLPLSLKNVKKGYRAKAPKRIAANRRNRRNAKKRTKYEYLLVLQGNYGYGHGWEDLAAVSKDKGLAEARREILRTRKEYGDNEGGNYRIVERRQPR